MGQTEIMVGLEHHQLLAHAVLPLAQRGDPPPYRRDPLTDSQVQPLHKCRIDVPATHGQDLLDAIHRAEHDPVLDGYDPPTPVRLDHLCIEQLWEWHPTRLRRGTLCLPPQWLYPLPVMGEQRGRVLFERSCTRPLRIIILPPNRVQCPQLNPFWRGQGHGLTSVLLPTRSFSHPMALRHVTCHRV